MARRLLARPVVPDATAVPRVRHTALPVAAAPQVSLLKMSILCRWPRGLFGRFQGQMSMFR